MTLIKQSDTVFQSNSGRAYSGVRVRAYLDGVEQPLYADDAGSPLAQAVTNANGAYSFWIEEGDYELRFSIGGVALGAGDYALFNLLRQRGGEPENLNAPAIGFWQDEGGANIHRLRDRILGGDGAKHTGRKTAPYGGSWLSEKVGTWIEKNAQASILSSESRIGILGGSYVADGATGPGTTGGVYGIAYNGGNGSTARGGYFEAILSGSTATAVFGIEVQLQNKGVDTFADSYSVSTVGAVIGAHISHEGGSGYTIGDADAPAGVSTFPATMAVNIAAGSGGTDNKKFKLGIRFGSNAIYGTDGVTGTGVAIGMAKGHTIEWRASHTILGATLRSDVNATGGQDTGLIFKNNRVDITGTGEVPIAQFLRDTAGAGAVNYLTLKNGRTGINLTIGADGSDTNIPIAIQTRGTGVLQLKGRGGNAESLRCIFNNDYVNFLTATGGVASGAATLGAAGSDTNVGLTLTTKAAGNLVLQPNTGDIQWGKALVALGGGSAPTLGTIGGSGPAVAAQNSWARMIDSTGAACWVPVWK